MDALALTATGACTRVRSIRVERVVDAARRRLPLLAKIGAGITERAFEERRASGHFGHIGLRESLQLVARGLGWEIERIDETLEPVLARRDAETKYLVVASGDVAGIHQVARGFARSASGELVEVLTLDLEMCVGAENPRDSVFVDGEPPIELQIAGGIFGDTATAGALVNAAGAVRRAAPGLRTVAELPLPRAFATDPTAPIPDA
jgi:2,4-diaminopentanoate dehydrogenase